MNIYNKLKNNITLLNTISTFALQLLLIVNGFIMPKIILSNFGSTVNGLVSSLTQLLSYISLVEGGITGVISAKLYKPLVEHDYIMVSKIIKTANSFYKKMSVFIIVYSLLIGCIYPFLVETEFSFIYIFLLTIILASGLFSQYCFSISLKCLLNTDKKCYIVSFTQIVMTLINILLAIISIKIYPSIHFLKLTLLISYICQPLIFKKYILKNYKLEYNIDKDNNLLKDRWSGFSVNLAAFIHNSTDITLLTFFKDLSLVSVYSIYILIINGIKQLINSISSGIVHTLGQSFYGNNKSVFEKQFNIYEFLMFFLSFYMFSVCSLLITPFVLLYTSNINDADYNQLVFGIIITFAECIYFLKYPHMNIAYISSKFKEISKACFIEAGLNIIISILLIKKFGLIGIATGTFIAMVYRLIYQVWFTNKYIFKRPQWIFYKKFIIFSTTSILGILICQLINIGVIDNYLTWTAYGILYSIIMLILFQISSIFFYKEEYLYFIKLFLSFVKNKDNS